MITPFVDNDNVQPYRPTVIDIETEGVNGTCIGIGMAWESPTGIEYRVYEDWSEWISGYRYNYRESDKETRERLRIIYAHNGSGFDWLHMARWLLENGYLTSLKCIQTGSAIVGINLTMSIDGDRFELKLRDSMKLLPTSLKDVTNIFALDEKKLELDGVLPEQLKNTNPDLYWEYLRIDVQSLQETLYKFWCMLVEITGTIGELPMTLPSLAMRLFRMSLTSDIWVPMNQKLKDFERESYTGGRTECIKPGDYPLVNTYDVNSEYPAVMLNGIYPVSYIGAWTKKYDGLPGIYRIRFTQTNRDMLPVLGVLENGGYHFAYDGSGTYTQPEIANLLRIGGDVEIERGYVYYYMGNPFVDFITKWYGIRLDAQSTGNEALAYTCKILMNSLYGKFGQQEIGKAIELWNSDQMVEQMEKGTKFTDIGDFVIVENKRRSNTTFCGIASYITSQARCLLYSYIEEATKAGGDVVYVDTDSVHVLGGEPLPTGNALGALKREYTGDAIYVRKKLYRFPSLNKNKAKGIGKKSAAELTDQDFRDMLSGKREIPVSFSVFPSAREVFEGMRKPAIMFERKRTLRGEP